MKIVVLDGITLGNIKWKEFEKFGEIEVYELTSKEERLERIKNAEIIITNKVVIDKEIMEKASKLKLICVAATGMNNIDLEYAKKKSIMVKNVVAYSTESVVQHTFAMAFYLIEQLKFYDEYVKTKKWSKSGVFTCLQREFFEINKKIWGIIGLGKIGKRVAEVAKCFGCEVMYFSTQNQDRDKRFKRVSLDELLSISDIISIHAPLNEKTRNLIDFEKLKLLKERAVLLNLGRGGIINEEDLVKILKIKNIFIGLDVTSIEPISPQNELLAFKDNLLITPHIAWTSIEARRKLIEGIKRNIEVFLQNVI
jgi:glycerate dehydrogenase